MCVDGKWLADETLCGNFWYIMTWIPALQQLLDGHVLNSYVMLDFGVQMKLSLTEQRKRLLMQGIIYLKYVPLTSYSNCST